MLAPLVKEMIDLIGWRGRSLVLAPLVKERIDQIGWNCEDDSLQRGRSLMLAPFVKEMIDLKFPSASC